MYESKWKSENVDKLFLAIKSLQDENEFYRFFDDLCTVSEIQSLAQRFEVAMLLEQGLKYHEITESTGASTATISRVARCLGYGADGYKIALKRLGVTRK